MKTGASDEADEAGMHFAQIIRVRDIYPVFKEETWAIHLSYCNAEIIYVNLRTISPPSPFLFRNPYLTAQ
jgi:hypothetical protein